MEPTFLLLVAFIFSSGQCQPPRDPSASPAACPSVCHPDISSLIGEMSAMKERLAAIESTSAPVPRLAFTAVLGHALGPFTIDTPVKYPRIISNVGNGYNPATGAFTARVPGTYYFSYTMFNNIGHTPNSVMSLMKNEQKMVSTWDTLGEDNEDSATNAAVLQLDAGDSVYIKLYATREVHDDLSSTGHYNTFSGFLLFPL
ncbi:complement C1q-like protein 4 [Gadus morhua]|nr:complement C1q-like protein 4 [Gadus morhua]